ncbi:MAG: hypothetical protein PHE53_01425 [Thermoguttaceae bacterium]|nr:hypothetical protein [Thermoguttaceae bacterium]
MSLLRVVCPKCGVRLKGDTKLIGRTIPCPQCKTPFLIQAPAETPPVMPSGGTASMAPPARPTVQTPPPARPAVPKANEPTIPLDDFPQGSSMHPLVQVSEDMGIGLAIGLNRWHRYLILGTSQIFARWESPATGWQIAGGTGFIPLLGNTSRLPREGDFRLVEMTLQENADTVRIMRMKTKKLPPIYPLAALTQTESAILTATLGDSGLLREQKNAVYTYLRERFMPEVLSPAQKLLDYLADYDLATSEVCCE